MSGLAWFLLDALLAAVTVFGTAKVFTSKPPQPLPASRLEGGLAPEKPASSREPKVVSLMPEAPEEALPPKASLEALWRETLFLPGRQEREPEEGEAQAQAALAATAEKNFEFELVGIAQISPTDKPPVPVAILRGRQAAARANSRPLPGRRLSPRGEEAQAAAKPAKPAKMIFREGDPINDTGYLLKAIYPEEKMVEVVRGGQVLQLRINYAGAEAAQRREALVEEQAKKRQAEEQQRQNSIRARQQEEQKQLQETQRAREAANPGLPPPPPGVGNDVGDAPVAVPLPANNAPAGEQDNRAQQIRRQVEENARQRNGNASPRRGVRRQ